jgi:hypothetical protein
VIAAAVDVEAEGEAEEAAVVARDMGEGLTTSPRARAMKAAKTASRATLCVVAAFRALKGTTRSRESVVVTSDAAGGDDSRR